MVGSSEPARVIIEQVTPSLDGGRYPIKRALGSELSVSATIFKDGDNLLAADLVVHAPGEAAPRRVALGHRYESDRWHASFVADRLGRWSYTIEAWPAAVAGARAVLVRRVETGHDAELELAELAALVARSALSRDEATARRLAELASRLGDPARPRAERLALALDAELAALARGPLSPEEVSRLPAPLELIVDRRTATFSAWYELFPRSQSPDPTRAGTFADTAQRLPELSSLGFDVVCFPPIHPTGELRRRERETVPGRDPKEAASPWLVGSRHGGHTAVHPELGTLDDFAALVAAAREHDLEIALDYSLDCAADHPWLREHPDWFSTHPDGSPRAVEDAPDKYEGSYAPNFWCKDREALWQACRDVLLFWIARGVRAFRVDQPHTKPFAFWEWLLGDVQARHPDVIFLSESFARPTRLAALAKLGFNQSYGYFTWKNSSWELAAYLTELLTPGTSEYLRPNFFVNTPDVLHEYLQTGGRPAFRVRLVLAATLSPAYGMYSGFELCEAAPARHGSEEYLDSEKYRRKLRDFAAPGNIKDDIALLNRIRRQNPALHSFTNLTLLPSDYQGILAYGKHAPGNDLIVVVNLDPFAMHESVIHVPTEALGIGEGQPFVVADLLTGEEFTWRGSPNYVRLDPRERVAHVFRLVRRG